MSTPTDLAAIPSDMDNDPRADEQIIDQQRGETVPAARPAEASDQLANSLALAIDGSGTALPGSTLVEGAPGKVVTEGITGAGPDEDEEALT
ncbi:MAG: hypothetical protein H7Z72_20955 [Bacteroidetes bacterium]|nr:hypothetical protein [Fibrella sp.]